MTSTMQYNPELTEYETTYLTSQSVYLESIIFDEDGLKVFVSSDDWKIQVIFEVCYGLRVLDERDLTEFWAKCNLKKNWIYVVSKGGWLSLESTRAHFISGRLHKPQEFFIIGLDECISVMTEENPTITQLSP